ncbi:unnamed protein product [Ceratitis capitata]|uniref:(Mediterranean fruit fly) hypothetical protein n=1 Tax=Ceratitis capitata TaxID=7213 RepID=A0A811U7S9_CERCA|nr:unnamed protein product [Ceratitis capitata]
MKRVILRSLGDVKEPVRHDRLDVKSNRTKDDKKLLAKVAEKIYWQASPHFYGSTFENCTEEELAAERYPSAESETPVKKLRRCNAKHQKKIPNVKVGSNV